MNIDGKTVYAHRFFYELFYSRIPDGYFVCHRCDNPRCVNPDHLFLGTQNDNIQDAIKKGRLNNAGERNGMAKLNEEQVDEIRERYERGNVSYSTLAEKFGVSYSLVHNIVKNPKKVTRVLPQEQVDEIRTAYSQRIFESELAEEYGVHENTINKIIRYKTYV